MGWFVPCTVTDRPDRSRPARLRPFPRSPGYASAWCRPMSRWRTSVAPPLCSAAGNVLVSAPVKHKCCETQKHAPPSARDSPQDLQGAEPLTCMSGRSDPIRSQEESLDQSGTAPGFSRNWEPLKLWSSYRTHLSINTHTDTHTHTHTHTPHTHRGERERTHTHTHI